MKGLETRKLFWAIWVGLNAIISVLVRERQGGCCTWVGSSVMVKTETGCAATSPGKLATSGSCKKQRMTLTLELREEAESFWHLGFQSSDAHFRLLASRTVREYISVLLNRQVYGNCLQWKYMFFLLIKNTLLALVQRFCYQTFYKKLSVFLKNEMRGKYHFP